MFKLDVSWLAAFLGRVYVYPSPLPENRRMQQLLRVSEKAILKREPTSTLSAGETARVMVRSESCEADILMAVLHSNP